MRSNVSFFLLSLLVVGCGARTGDELFLHTEGDVDAGTDTHVEPGGCPRTLPTPGTTCGESRTCAYAGACGPDLPDIAICSGGRWGIVGTSCPPKCPVAQPSAGSPCPSGTPRCAYANVCGAEVAAVCLGGRWNVTDPGCATPCPTVEPKNGDACGPTATKCNWTSACGGTDFGGCDGKRWSITIGECPCPGARPAIGAACPNEGKACSWTNLCKTIDTGVCTGGRWKLDIKPCGTCPLFSPRDGTACTTSAGCKYYAGTDFCTSQCACDGVRWSCGPC